MTIIKSLEEAIHGATDDHDRAERICVFMQGYGKRTKLVIEPIRSIYELYVGKEVFIDISAGLLKPMDYRMGVVTMLRSGHAFISVDGVEYVVTDGTVAFALGQIEPAEFFVSKYMSKYYDLLSKSGKTKMTVVDLGEHTYDQTVLKWSRMAIGPQMTYDAAITNCPKGYRLANRTDVDELMELYKASKAVISYEPSAFTVTIPKLNSTDQQPCVVNLVFTALDTMHMQANTNCGYWLESDDKQIAMHITDEDTDDFVDWFVFKPASIHGHMALYLPLHV